MAFSTKQEGRPIVRIRVISSLWDARRQTLSQAAVSIASSPARALPVSASSGGRLVYLDNLKVALTILVIAHHVGQAYGPTGGAWPVMEAQKATFLGPFFTVNRSFFMSLFFFISGFLMVAAHARQGTGVFVKSKLHRLGVPVLAFMLISLPVRLLAFHERIISWDGILNAGHLWYLEHLLLYSLVYALIETVATRKRRREEQQGSGPQALPSLALEVSALFVIVALTGLVRTWSPIDRWFNLLGFFSVAFADVPRDLGFFVFGVVAARKNWLARYPSGKGYAWLTVGVIAALGWYLWSLVPFFHFPLQGITFAVVRLVWEGILCFGLCIGLLIFGRDRWNRRGALGSCLASNQYSAYFWHPIIVIMIQKAALGLPISSGGKFLLVTILSLPIVFGWSWLARRSAAIRNVL